MKNKYPLVFIVALGIGIVWWQFRHQSQEVATGSATTNLASAQQSASGGTTPQTLKQQADSQSAAATSPAIPPAVSEYVQKSMADPQYDWKQPINFWGRVVDESNEPVANSSVHFAWNDISEKGTSDADTTSDGNGFFSLTDRKGKRLYVDVSKEGYYSSGDSRGAAFEYANPADGLFTPDRNNPVVFHLRKKGVGVDLITSQYGMSPDFPVHIPRDGTPIKIDFLQRKTGDSGQMQISENKPEYANWKQATNWSFKMEIPDGGFIKQNDEFPFEAPESGYQPVVEFNFQQGQTDWVENLKKNYYIKFGNPSRYGLLRLETGISMGGAILTYAINPDGSRNLEPK